jgi:hypothetical protein
MTMFLVQTVNGERRETRERERERENDFSSFSGGDEP